MTTKRFYRVATGDPRRDELRARYRDADEILREPEHNMRSERPRRFGASLELAVRQMAARGFTDSTIARELGVDSLEKVHKVRQFLGCPGTTYEGSNADAEAALLRHEDDDTPPEAA